MFSASCPVREPLRHCTKGLARLELLTEYAQEQYGNQLDLANDYHVQIRNKQPVVGSRKVHLERFEVDLDKLTCECGYPLQFQLPCSHLILLASARVEANDYVGWIRRFCSRWLLEDYVKGLKEVTVKLVSWTCLVADGVTTSPPVMNPVGRPRKQTRIEARRPKETQANQLGGSYRRLIISA